MPLNHKTLAAQLEQHEGLRLKPYRCSSGKLTIGVGRNLDDVGITRDEAYTLLHNDMDRVLPGLEALPFWGRLDETRQLVLADMAFNLGIAGLLKFRRMLAAVEKGDYQQASAEMLKSRWAEQVKVRAVHLAKMMRS